jgi:hypothetical protein
MKIPKHIHVGGLRVKIAIVENLEDFGSFSLDDLTISIRKGHIKEMTDTLRHEMMHAAFAIGGIAHCKPFEEAGGVVRCLNHLFFPAWGELQQTKINKTMNAKFELLRNNSMDQWMTIGEHVGQPSIKYIQNLILSYDGYEVPDKDAKDILDGVGISQKNVSTITYKLVPIEQ